METKIEKMNGGWVVRFGFGNQSFNLWGEWTKEEAEYQERLLKECFKTYKESLK